ncbi:MAG: aspartate kinase [Elusimicrobia bacterium]|nr:aspartate kinase [Elusimicrobiota bacterium]
MKIKVLKFGGTSVADPEKIHRAAGRAIAARRLGWGVVVVVSAPGEMTDELIHLGRRIHADPDPRELDQLMAAGEVVAVALLATACLAQGRAAVSLTGPQAGVEASGRHGGARLLRIRPRRILAELRRGRIVAVAGFQGADARGDVATLGRGGSDLSAVALAAALKARHCEIYSDVKGVYTADPRIVPDARKLRRISFEEMLELSGAGSQVMQARSIEVARAEGVSLHVRSAFHPQEGTWIVPGGPRTGGSRERPRVSSLALDKGSARPGAPEDGGRAAKVSVVGTGLDRSPQLASRVLATLSKHRIDAELASASALRLSALVEAGHAEAALRALHKAFGLGRRQLSGHRACALGFSA